jgi:redox-sensitive bicupin YhaK (pirin superfamily)
LKRHEIYSNRFEFEDHGGEIAFHNPTDYEVEFFVIGGEKYTESFVAHGPFVMSTREEIKITHNDYVLGKYGEIKYN